MRDAARIRPFCEELAAQWEKHPDMRFGQLVANALGVNSFYVEDDVALERIRAFESDTNEYVGARSASTAVLGEDVCLFDPMRDMRDDEFADCMSGDGEKYKNCGKVIGGEDVHENHSIKR